MMTTMFPIRRAARYFQGVGGDAQGLLKEAGFSAEQLRHGNRFVHVEGYHRFLQSMSEAADEPLLGIRIAQNVGRGSAGLFGYLFFHHTCLEEAIRSASMYYGAFRPDSFVETSRDGDVVRFSVGVRSEHPGAVYEQQELVLLAWTLARFATHGRFVPTAVHFRDVLPGSQHELDAVLGARVVAGSSFYGLEFDASCLSLPFPDADEELLPHLVRAAEHHIADVRKAMGDAAGILPLRGCAVDLRLGVVRRDGEAVPLTSKELQLLAFMARRPNQLVLQADIERDVWQISGSVLSHAPAVAIRRLRAKIEEDLRHPVNLVTVRGEGWMLRLSGVWGDHA